MDVDERLERWLQEVDYWFIDLDGTLVHSTPYRQVLKTVSRIVGVPYDKLLRRYRDEWEGLDEAREFHYSLAANDGQRDDIKVTYTHYATDSHSPTVIPGSFAFLEALRALDKCLVCYTRGIHSWQMAKLQVTGLSEFFHDICIVTKKDIETIQTHAMRMAYDKPIVMVGNNFVEDIAPARGIALGRIYVTHDPHAVDERRPSKFSDDILVIDTVNDLVRPIIQFRVAQQKS